MRIAFLGLKCYPLLTGEVTERVLGGAEVQQVLLGRELANRGHEVTFVVYDHGQPRSGTIRGVRFERAFDPSGGVPGLRFLHPRLSGLWSAMHRADAEVYYQRGWGLETGQAAWWCRRQRRRFTFALAAMTGLTPAGGPMRDWRARRSFLYGLKRADAVIAQSEEQAQSLHDRFGVRSVVIRSAAQSADWCCTSPPVPPVVLWLGRFHPVKRIHELIEIAQRWPQIRFELVGGGSGNYADQVRAFAGQVPNVALHAPVPHAQVDAFYRRTACLICTSEHEGFPNTFLEAWARGIPVVSTVDPDGWIQRGGLGVFEPDLEQLPHRLAQFLTNPDAWQAASAAARRHFDRHHSLASSADAYEHVFRSLILAPRGATSAARQQRAAT